MLQKMAKITYILNLKGRALQCAQALINSNVELSYAEFMNKFRCVFVKRTSSDSADIAYSSSNKENKVLQITLWILLPEETGREETVLCGAFLHGFNDDMASEFAAKDLPILFINLFLCSLRWKTMCVSINTAGPAGSVNSNPMEFPHSLERFFAE